MAILTTEKIRIGAMKSDKEDIISYLQSESSVELIEAEQGEIYKTTKASNNVTLLKNQLATSERAFAILESYDKTEKSMFESLKPLDVCTLADCKSFKSSFSDVFSKAEKIFNLDKMISDKKSEIVQLEVSFEELKPWLDLDLSLDFRGTKHTAVYIGSLSGNVSESEITEKIEAINPGFDEYSFQIISHDEFQTRLIFVTLRTKKQDLKTILEQLSFSFPRQRISENPRVAFERITEKIAVYKKEIEECESQLKAESESIAQIKLLVDYLIVQIDIETSQLSLGESNYTFLLEGYVLSRDTEKIRKSLEQRFDCTVEFLKVDDSENAPVLMKNNWFSEPLEDVISSFGYPTKNDVDPTLITSIFYYFMFGLMFSDAAYGFILSSVTGIILLKYKEMKATVSKFLRLFFWCGISTMFWGVMFSSYFGDIVNVVSKTFFGTEVSIAPRWFSPLDDPMRLLIFCFGIGILHLVTGYAMNAANSIKNKNYSAVVFDAVLPVTFLGGFLIYGMTTPMFEGMASFKIELNEIVKTICLGVSVASMVGLLLTSGRESKNWGKRLLKGIFGLYNVIAGWISDILSYSRLLALGLATGVIASVVNTLGAMLGKGIIAVVGFIIIFLIGHGINFAINILGSYVHSNRLEYVEFFGKFFGGEGKCFKPVSFNTKFFKFKEEN